MAKRLTTRMLDAIAIMANQVEAGGIDEVQGIEGEDQERVYEDMMAVRDWAEQELAKRRAKAAARK